MILKKPHIYCLGANHKSAALDFREYLFIQEQQLALIMPDFAAKHQFSELIVMSTCNRFELYGLSDEKAKTEESLYEAYIDLQIMAGKQRRTVADFKTHTYLFEGLKAIEHMFAVAASLDSLVVGETQITGQFKDAISTSAATKTLGPFLDRMTQDILKTAKKVRTQTKIGEKKVSISHAAIDLAKRVFTDIGEQSFLLIGAGEMAQVAARYAVKYNPREIFIVNRTFAKALDLVDTIAAGTAKPWEQLETLLTQVDIVISSTAAFEPVIDYPMLRRVMRKRRHKSLFLVDIAIPRDIEPRCQGIDEVYLFEIDDLQKVVDTNLDERRRAADAGRVIVKKSSVDFDRWLSVVSIKPIFAGFRDYLQSLCQRELKKSFARSELKGLTDQQRKAIEILLSSVSSKIVGDAARAVNNPEDVVSRDQLAHSLRILFPNKLNQASPVGPDENSPSHVESEDDSQCQNKVIQI